jgi:hypothetical protein
MRTVIKLECLMVGKVASPRKLVYSQPQDDQTKSGGKPTFLTLEIFNVECDISTSCYQISTLDICSVGVVT